MRHLVHDLHGTRPFVLSFARVAAIQGIIAGSQMIFGCLRTVCESGNGRKSSSRWCRAGERTHLFQSRGAGRTGHTFRSKN